MNPLLNTCPKYCIEKTQTHEKWILNRIFELDSNNSSPQCAGHPMAEQKMAKDFRSGSGPVVGHRLIPQCLVAGMK
jgi:hypothetical protein